MNIVTCGFLLALALLLPSPGQPQPLADFEVQVIAPGVVVARPVRVRHGFVEPNVAFVIGDRGVMVVDAGFLPSSAKMLISKLKTVTDKPVLYLVNTHWHGDHHHGNSEWRSAFPSVRIIAHAEGSREIVERGVPDVAGFIRSYSDRVDASRRTGAPELAVQENVLEQLRELKVLPPDTTFVDTLDVDLGNKPVRLRYLGLGNTFGDAVVELPAERIVITGDLVVFPRPYLSSDHFAAWSLTLERLGKLNPAIIVPGHGAIQSDADYLHRLRGLLSTMLLMIDEAVAGGLTREQARSRITSDTLRSRLERDWQIPPDIVSTLPAVIQDFVDRAYEQRTRLKAPIK